MKQIYFVADYIAELSKVVGYEINDFEALKKAISERIEFFHNAGCRISDHGMTISSSCPKSPKKRGLPGIIIAVRHPLQVSNSTS